MDRCEEKGPQRCGLDDGCKSYDEHRSVPGALRGFLSELAAIQPEGDYSGRLMAWLAESAQPARDRSPRFAGVMASALRAV